MNFKKPSNTICLIVVVLLLFILCCGAFVYSQINDLTEPLENEHVYKAGEKLADSVYTDFEIIEQRKEYTILRDAQTDVLYIELRRNGYSSALTVLFNADGTPKTYSQFLDG
jgi:archaellum component FlaG (FlaF/FlaG flagellin family)